MEILAGKGFRALIFCAAWVVSAFILGTAYDAACTECRSWRSTPTVFAFAGLFLTALAYAAVWYVRNRHAERR